jgi:hypothetical protein
MHYVLYSLCTTISGKLHEFGALSRTEDNVNYISFAGGGETLSFTHTIASTMTMKLTIDENTKLAKSSSSNLDTSITVFSYSLQYSKQFESSSSHDVNTARSQDK